MHIYSYLYRPIQNLIFLILKKNVFHMQLSKFLNDNLYEEIHDIGCADGNIVSFLCLKKTKYFGYDIDSINIKKAKFKYKNQNNIKFINKSINKINIKNKRKKIFILIGVFHHISDKQILNFLKKIKKNDSVIALDGFFHKNQNLIGYLMKKIDRGKYIRTYTGYKNLLSGFVLIKKISQYIKFYSHLITYKNIDKKKINYYFR